MKKILLIVALLGSGYAFSQSMPPTFPVEMYYGCTYEKGKDIEDMMEVGEDWREWQEENDPVGRENYNAWIFTCLLYTSPSPRDRLLSRMPSSA